MKPTVLYRGAKERVNVLTPQPILQNERSRFPSEIDKIVFATAYKEDALAYAIAARKGLGGFQLTPYWRNEESQEIGWKLGLSCSRAELNVNERTYLYELDPEGFQVTENGEWYSTEKVVPQEITEMRIDEALGYFDEVTFGREGQRTAEGQAGLSR